MTLALRILRLPAKGLLQKQYASSCDAINRLNFSAGPNKKKVAIKSCPVPDVVDKRQLVPPPAMKHEWNAESSVEKLYPKICDRTTTKINNTVDTSATTDVPTASPATATTTTDSSTCKTNADATPAKKKQKLSSEVMRQNVKGYFFTRYFDIVKNYDKVLEKNFPSAMKVYRVFFDGVKDFYADMKYYLKIARIANTSEQGLKALNRKELELFMSLPRDMVKVAPALIFSSLPMVGYVIFPLVFMYPRTFLTTHFWTLQQRSEFKTLYLKERLNTNRAVFRCLQGMLHSSKKSIHHGELKIILAQLGSGFQPNVNSILQVKDIFAENQFNMHALSGKHIKLLCRMHGVPRGWFKRHRLTEHAFLVHYMDLAILREGGVHNMPPEALRQACYIRGLNPANLGSEEMIEWLRNWVTISTDIQEEHISLFLHLPLFLAYNHPNNWQLIYTQNQCK